MKRECIGCSHQHDGQFSQDFCSRSCWLVWRWRKYMGFGKNGTGRYVIFLIAMGLTGLLDGCAAHKAPTLCLPPQPAPTYTDLQCFPVDVQSGQVMCVKQIQFGGGQ